MRKVLINSDAIFNDSALDFWNQIITRMANLPISPVSPGLEAAFSIWLGEERSAHIKALSEDELSPFLAGGQRQSGIFGRRIPSELFCVWGIDQPTVYMDVAMLEKCAALSSDIPDQRVRNFRHFSSRDARGGRQEFVSPAELSRAISEFCRVWNSEWAIKRNPVPIWLFVALLNAHPFGDGNGRLARGLLNIFMARAGLLKNHLIPFGPLIHATQGNFELAMGRAAIMNNWEPVVKTFYQLINFYADVQEEFLRDYQG